MRSNSRSIRLSVSIRNFNLANFLNIIPRFLPHHGKCSNKKRTQSHSQGKGISSAMCHQAMPMGHHNRDTSMILVDSALFREHCLPYDLFPGIWSMTASLHTGSCNSGWPRTHSVASLTWNSKQSVLHPLNTPSPNPGGTAGHHYAWLDIWRRWDLNYKTTALLELKF